MSLGNSVMEYWQNGQEASRLSGRSRQDLEEGRHLGEAGWCDSGQLDQTSEPGGEEGKPQAEKSEIDGLPRDSCAAPVEFCEPAKRVFIAMPSYGSKPSYITNTALQLMDRIFVTMGLEPPQSQIYAGDPYLDNARNALVTAFLETDCTDLLFVDDDVGWEPNAVARILRARRPYVACLYPKKQDLLEFPVDFIDPSNVRGNEEGLVEVRMVPTGFLRLNRAVFDVMPHVDYPCNSTTYKGYFWTQITPHGYIGEDVMFANVWRLLGGKIFVVPDVNMWHTGTKTWHGNMHNWMMATFHRGEAELKEELEREVAKRQPGIKRGPLEGNPGEIRQGDAEASRESPQAAD